MYLIMSQRRGSVCKSKAVTYSILSTSGHYDISMTRTNNNAVLKIRALPNGGLMPQMAVV